MKFFRLLVLALMMLPAMALAHGPSRQKVTVTKEINATPEEVWAVVGDFYDMSWHPAVFATEGDGTLVPDESLRSLTVGEEGGPVITEILYKWKPEKMSYSYRITDVDVAVLPVTNYSSHLTVKPAEDGHVLVEWRGAFYRGYPNNEPPEHLNDEAAVKAVTDLYNAGLDALAAQFPE